MSDTKRKPDFETILLDPALVYDSPADVLRDDGLSDDQKLRVLQAWEIDARELAVAEEESMGGGEDARLSPVLQAINELARRTGKDIESEDKAPTKQGVHGKSG
ncbi:MAG: hypothetical protein WD407_14045 [Rhodospirillales bacterium]